MIDASLITPTSTTKVPKRYKPLGRGRVYTRPFREISTVPRIDDHREKYPSRPVTMDCTSKRESRPAINVTIAPAYNKGAYQVIPHSDIKHIGR